MSLGLIKQTAASVPTPPVNEQNIFIDSSDDRLKKKLSDNTIVPMEQNAAGVASFEGRTGNVISQAGDYNAQEINNTPAGNISSTNVQNALNELDAEKADVFYSTLSPNVVASDVTVPSGYTWLRQTKSIFNGATKISLLGNAKIIFIG